MQTRTLTAIMLAATVIVSLSFLALWRNPYTRSILTGEPVSMILTQSVESIDTSSPQVTIPTPSQPKPIKTPRLDLPESYCLLPDETVWDVAQRSHSEVDAFKSINPKFTGFAGSALHLPPGSLPPFAWAPISDTIRGVKDLPFGVSGYFIGHDNRRKRISLTFDIGYVPENIELMKMLEERGISATFFVIGTAMKNKPEVVHDVMEHGHELANHSWTHDYMQTMDEEGIINELRWTEDAVRAAHPEASTKPFFRAPFGAITPEMVAIAEREGYYTVGWTIDSGDWVPGMTPDEIYTRIIDNVCPGAIIVMHDANLPSFAALPRILDTLKEQEYEVVPLSTLMFPS